MTSKIQDILFKTDKQVFSYRVAGLFIHHGRILLQRPNNDTGYSIPGGHVRFGETNEQTLIREFKEEINADIKVGSLQWVNELFFPWGKRDCHQICLYYRVSLADHLQKIPLEGSFFGTDELENAKIDLEFSWIDLKVIPNIELYPIEAKTLLFNGFDKVEHFNSREENFIIHLAEMTDLLLWMKLVEFVRDQFPGLESIAALESHRQTVIKNINRKTAICARQNGIITGILIFSPKKSCLSYMAVHPAYRRRGIATALIEKMLSLLPLDKDIWVTTFRENDEKGTAPRALYKKFGFVEDELCTEFNYLTQKFVLHRV